MERLIGLLGIVVLLAIAVLFSSNRRWIRLRIVIPAFLLQAGFAILVIGTPWGRAVIQAMSNGVSNLLGYAKAGTDFIFGPLASPEMGANSFAIAALPVIIFFASLIRSAERRVGKECVRKCKCRWSPDHYKKH